MAEPSPATETTSKYRRLAVLGRGGMATVYLAALKGQRGFTKLVVVKELRTELALDPEYTAMFSEEARIAARLSHPNVVQTFEVHEDGASTALVMEHLDGQPYTVVRRKLAAKMPLALHVHVICEILEGLHHAHELRGFDGAPLGLVHRDVSPHNVIVTYDGDVKLLDFGIAKLVHASENLTQTGMLKGKLAYMAPEQTGGGAIDRRADLFAMGILLWEVLAGRRMWGGVEPAQILGRLIGGDLPALPYEAVAPHPDLAAVCAKALSMRAEDRFGSAREMLSAVEAAFARSPSARRELSASLLEAFADERASQASVIARQLSLAESVPTGEFAPVRLSSSGESISGVRATLSTASPPVVVAEPSLSSAPTAARGRVSPAALAALGIVVVLAGATLGGWGLWARAVAAPSTAPASPSASASSRIDEGAAPPALASAAATGGAPADAAMTPEPALPATKSLPRAVATKPHGSDAGGQKASPPPPAAPDLGY